MNGAEFFAMGGYALYVWGSYVAAAVVLVANIWAAWHRGKSVRRELRNLERLKQSEGE
jgi:heme exporter protein D